MKFICSHEAECDGRKACLHARSHDECGHTCQRVAGARCVMDVESLPEIGDTGTVAIMISRREEAACMPRK